MRTAQQIEQLVPITDRSAQRFPPLRPAQLDVARCFADAPVRSFAPGESIFNVGDRAVSAWFLLSGSAQLFGRDGLDQQIAMETLESGQFTGELHQLTAEAARPSASPRR
jgi:thioredoxin reductase (NADPH)